MSPDWLARNTQEYWNRGAAQLVTGGRRILGDLAGHETGIFLFCDETRSAETIRSNFTGADTDVGTCVQRRWGSDLTPPPSSLTGGPGNPVAAYPEW